jgi:acyl-CoA synthetase (AMP-forming)/AMP-acid ligase II
MGREPSGGRLSALPSVLVTARDSERDQRRAAAALAAMGLQPGDRVAVIAEPSPAYLAVTLGALRTGVVPVLLNPALLPVEREQLLADAEPAAVLSEPDLPPLVHGDAEAELADVPLARPMLYTSGTTGTPKGVWTGVLDERDAHALVDEERDVWGFESDDRNLVVSPLHHSAPLRFATGTLLAGGEVVLAGPFEPQRFAAAVTEHAPTTAFVVPAHLQRLFSSGGFPPLDSFRLLAHAGAPCPEGLKRRALAEFPEGSVWEFYGSTEGQFTSCSPDDWLAYPGTVGRARPERELDVDPDGVIWCRMPGPSRFEYWHDPAKTAQAWRDDWLTVGDVGHLDDGFLFLEGRRDDLIISGGVNVYPVEVERVLLAHPEVIEAAVFPVDDERWGQMVVAAVVADAEPDALDAHARAHLAPYKRPKRIVLVEEIPVSATGKVRRSTLAADLGLS